MTASARQGTGRCHSKPRRSRNALVRPLVRLLRLPARWRFAGIGRRSRRHDARRCLHARAHAARSAPPGLDYAAGDDLSCLGPRPARGRLDRGHRRAATTRSMRIFRRLKLKPHGSCRRCARCAGVRRAARSPEARASSSRFVHRDGDSGRPRSGRSPLTAEPARCAHRRRVSGDVRAATRSRSDVAPCSRCDRLLAVRGRERRRCSRRHRAQLAESSASDIDFVLDLRPVTPSWSPTEHLPGWPYVHDGEILAARFVNQGPRIRRGALTRPGRLARYYHPDGTSHGEGLPARAAGVPRVSSRLHPRAPAPDPQPDPRPQGRRLRRAHRHAGQCRRRGPHPLSRPEGRLWQRRWRSTMAAAS